MATPFSDVTDLALVVIDDYKLVQLSQIDEDAFKTYLEGFLVTAIPDFDGCKTDLSYNLATATFENNLNAKEKSILSKFMVIKWFEREVNDIKQINLGLQGRDFKRNSEASNLKEKSEYIDRLREKVKQDITDYQLSYMMKQVAQ